MPRKQIKVKQGAAGSQWDSYAILSENDIEVRALARMYLIVLRRSEPARTELWEMIFGNSTKPLSNKIIYEET